MHLVVTGGAGFIGSNFTSLALAKGASVTVLDALTYASGRQFVEADMKLYPNRCKLVVDSILNRETVYDLVRDADAVVHFAAESHNDNSLRDPLLFMRTNVDGTAMLLEAAREFDVRFHHVSTDEVYGDLPLNPPEVHRRKPVPAILAIFGFEGGGRSFGASLGAFIWIASHDF